jgi:hypothetical protein
MRMPHDMGSRNEEPEHNHRLLAFGDELIE